MRRILTLARYTLLGTILEPVAASGNGDDFGVMEQPVEDGAGGGDVHLIDPFSAARESDILPGCRPSRRINAVHIDEAGKGK